MWTHSQRHKIYYREMNEQFTKSKMHQQFNEMAHEVSMKNESAGFRSVYSEIVNHGFLQSDAQVPRICTLVQYSMS